MTKHRKNKKKSENKHVKGIQASKKVSSKQVNSLNSKQEKKSIEKNKSFNAKQKQNNSSKQYKKNGLSNLQEDMRRRLDGSKFRMLNEQLYTCSGEDSFQTFQAEPELFDIYHRGFREQAEKWPVNPLDILINYVKQSPKAIVADFGCGDARLAESVTNTVHSFDLVSRKPHVIACNIANVPLPKESIDIGIYCLALMGGTSVVDYIKEAHRVLKLRGILHIAEVKSRFETSQVGGINGFITWMERDMGFQCKHKEEGISKMFVLMQFIKVKIKISTQKDATSIVLKACEYKRR